MSTFSQRAADGCRPARSLRFGIVCDGAIVKEWHVDVEVPFSVGLAGAGSQGPVRIVPTQDGPLLMLTEARGVSGRLGRGGRIRPLAEWMAVVGHRHGVLLKAGDRLRVTVPGGTVLVQGMSHAWVASLAPGSFRPLLVQRGDAPFLGMLSSCASAAMALLVVAAGMEPTESLAYVEPPERVVQVLMRSPVPQAPEPESITPDPAAEDQRMAEVEPPPQPEPRPIKEVVADVKTKRLRRLANRSAVVGRLDQMAQILGQTGDETALRAALDRTGDTAIIAAKGGVGGFRGGDGGEGRRDAAVVFGDGLGGVGAADNGPVLRRLKATEPSKRRVTFPIASTQSGGPSGVIDELRRRYARQLQGCYERRLNVNPTVRGRVELSFDVEGGVVSFAVVSENRTGDEALADCLESRAARWRFSADAAGSFVVPLVFEQD